MQTILKHLRLDGNELSSLRQCELLLDSLSSARQLCRLKYLTGEVFLCFYYILCIFSGAACVVYGLPAIHEHL
jgi:hypothetical protein